MGDETQSGQPKEPESRSVWMQLVVGLLLGVVVLVALAFVFGQL